MADETKDGASGAPAASLGLVRVRVHAHAERGFWRGEHEGRSLHWPGGGDGTEIELPPSLVERLEAEPNLRVRRLEGEPFVGSATKVNPADHKLDTSSETYARAPESSLLGPDPKPVQGPDGTLAGPSGARRGR